VVQGLVKPQQLASQTLKKLELLAGDRQRIEADSPRRMTGF
jgi:hypothetical protein